MKKYVWLMVATVAVCLTACGKQEVVDEAKAMNEESIVVEENTDITENAEIEEDSEEVLIESFEETIEDTSQETAEDIDGEATEEILSEVMQEDSCPFQLMDSFVPDGLFRTYNGGFISMSVYEGSEYTLTLDEENQILSITGNEESFSEGEYASMVFSRLTEGVYKVQVTSNMERDTDSGYLVQQGEKLDWEKEMVQMWRCHSTKYGENSFDVLELDSESGKAMIYRFSANGEEIESREEYGFEYEENDNKLIFFDEEGTVDMVWDLELSNGAAVIETSYYNLVGALVRIEEMPESVEPVIVE